MIRSCVLLLLCLTIASASDDTLGQSLSEDGVPLTLLTDPLAKCLDGSQYGYYFMPAAPGSVNATKWQINIQGGGWCYNETLCLERASTTLGSSTQWPKESPVPLIFEGWNTVYMRYCDGGSFSGFRTDPVPVPGQPGKTLYFRGFQNLKSTIDALGALGWDKATEVILTGGSAGGLSTILHADYVATRVPAGARFVATPNCGFFLHHGPLGAAPNSYIDEMTYVAHMQHSNVSLSPTCMNHYGDSWWNCIFAPYAAPFVQTPLYLRNSQTDHWQLAEILFESCEQRTPYTPPYPSSSNCTSSEIQGIKDYGPSFRAALQNTIAQKKNGAFIVACIIHGVSTELEINGVSLYDAFAEWYESHGTNANRVMMEECPGGVESGPCNKSPLCAPFPRSN